MKLRFNLVVWCMLAQTLSYEQQANVNLDYNPQKNTENLIPFSAPLNSPDVPDDGTVTFRLRAAEAKNVRISGVALLTALGSSGKPVPFKKGEDGVWTLTVGPLRPDMDNLLAEGKVTPMVIAIPNNHVGRYGGHDWSTWRHLLYYRFLPNLWRKN